jgi:RNA polymerase sigma-70 factor (ECF subfamily)
MAKRPVPDSTLLRRLAEGDASALGALYDHHATGLFRWLLAQGLPRCDAEDLLSECFLALVDRGERAADIEDVGAYLFAVARHRLARIARRSQSEALDLIAEPAASDAPADALAIREALTDLPPEQREVVVLKVWQGRTFDEIGRLLGISPNTASSRYRYALEKLRAALGETEDG